MTANSFLVSGGDGYVTLKAMRESIQGGLDLDALEAWLKPTPPRAVPAEKRAIDVNAR